MKNLLLTLLFFPSVILAQDTKDLLKYEKNGYFNEYPSHWMLNDSGDNGTEFYLYPNTSESSDVFIESINFIKHNLNGAKYTIEKCKAFVEKQISEILTDPKINLSEIINEDEIKFHKLK